MAVVSPPSLLQFGSHSALSDRLTVASLLQAGATPLVSRGGVRPSGDNGSLQVVAQGSPNNTVSVKAGSVFIPEADGAGVYIAHNDAAVNLTIGAASPTLNRKDIVVMQINDQEVSGVTNSAALGVVAGTAVSGTASPPAVPVNAYNLAEINIAAAGSTIITNAMITDKRAVCVAAGGTLPVLSTALPANPYPGMSVYCSDTDEYKIWNATAAAWRTRSVYPLPDPAVLGYTSSVQAITATTWANLPTRQFIAFTAAKPLWVMLHLAAWMNVALGTDLRATLALTGATTGPGTGGVLLNVNNYGDVIFNGAGNGDRYSSHSFAIPYLLNAGTTTVEVKAYRVNTSAATALNYAEQRITPLWYA